MIDFDARQTALDTLEPYPVKEVSVGPYTAKGKAKWMVRLDDELAKTIFVRRDPEALERFLATVAKALSDNE